MREQVVSTALELRSVQGRVKRATRQRVWKRNLAGHQIPKDVQQSNSLYVFVAKFTKTSRPLKQSYANDTQSTGVVRRMIQPHTL